MLINSLGLKNFKCFEELDVKFAPITLLTGANSSGKSSLIDAILAVLQTEQFPFYLSPNGKYVNMGSFEEMVFGKDISKDIQINIQPAIDSYRDFTPIFNWTWFIDNASGLPKLKNLLLKFEGGNLVHETWKLNVETTEDYYNLTLHAHASDVRFEDIVRYSFDRIESIKNNLATNDISLRVVKQFSKLKDINELYNHPYFLFKSVFNASCVVCKV